MTLLGLATREPCRLCDGKGGVTESNGADGYVSAKCPQCFGFGTEEIVDLISDAIGESLGPDWDTRLAARFVADALSDAGLARARASQPLNEEK